MIMDYFILDTCAICNGVIVDSVAAKRDVVKLPSWSYLFCRFILEASLWPLFMAWLKLSSLLLLLLLYCCWYKLLLLQTTSDKKLFLIQTSTDTNYLWCKLLPATSASWVDRTVMWSQARMTLLKVTSSPFPSKRSLQGISLLLQKTSQKKLL